MTDRQAANGEHDTDARQQWDRGWDEHRLRQATRGLELTPVERLRWLEETMETMRRWLGRAQHGRPVDRR